MPATADLSRLSSAARGLEAFLTAPQPTFTRVELDAQKDDLELARLALRSDPGLLSLSERAGRLRLRLLERETSFDGRDLPTRPELASAPVELAFHRPIYDGPRELLDDARTVRAGVESLWKPRSLLGSGSWGAASWFGNDANEVIVAAADFETRCQSSYKNVRDTVSAYQHLARAYSRIGTIGWSFNETSDIRRLETAMDRLGRFYSTLGVAKSGAQSLHHGPVSPGAEQGQRGTVVPPGPK